MKFIDVKPGHAEQLAASSGQPELVHVFEERSIQAVNAALAAGRPLLLRGEPGIGKTQLARAVAKVLRRAFIQHVVDAQGESRDLLWYFDAVQRLADAQMWGAVEKDVDKVREKLAVENFLRPGPLWWAFDWQDALSQAVKVKMAAPHQRDGGDYQNGCVVLVDEIDKAETDMPNGLLEALGAGEFTPFGRSQAVTPDGSAPLVMITTNEERALPDAFVRRCLVLHLALPKEEAELQKFLLGRGRSHFPDMNEQVIAEAAKMLTKDRQEALAQHRLPLPGQAEFLDLLRAVNKLVPNNPEEQKKCLLVLSEFTLKKHTGVF